MDTRATYGAGDIQIRSECLQPYSKKWEAPTGDEIKAAFSMAGWSGLEFSRRIGVDGRTVRRWTGDEKEIPYAAWSVLCSQAKLGSIWQ